MEDQSFDFTIAIILDFYPLNISLYRGYRRYREYREYRGYREYREYGEYRK